MDESLKPREKLWTGRKNLDGEKLWTGLKLRYMWKRAPTQIRTDGIGWQAAKATAKIWPLNFPERWWTLQDQQETAWLQKRGTLWPHILRREAPKEKFLCVEEIGFSLKSGVKIMDGGLKPREKSCTQISSIIFPFVFNPTNNFSPPVI